MTTATRNKDVGKPGNGGEFASPLASAPEVSLDHPNPLLAQFAGDAVEGQSMAHDWLYALHYYEHKGDLDFDGTREDEPRESVYHFISRANPDRNTVAEARRTILAHYQPESGIPVFNNNEELADYIESRGGRGWMWGRNPDDYTQARTLYRLHPETAKLLRVASERGAYAANNAQLAADGLAAVFAEKEAKHDFGLSDEEIIDSFRVAFSSGISTEMREHLAEFLEDRNFHTASILMDVGDRTTHH